MSDKLTPIYAKWVATFLNIHECTSRVRVQQPAHQQRSWYIQNCQILTFRWHRRSPDSVFTVGLVKDHFFHDGQDINSKALTEILLFPEHQKYWKMLKVLKVNISYIQVGLITSIITANYSVNCNIIYWPCQNDWQHGLWATLQAMTTKFLCMKKRN